MRGVTWIGLLLLCAVSGCSGGDSGVEGTFFLIEFLEGGQDSLARNRELSFKFSAPVQVAQDFAERLKILNVQTGAGQSDFSRALGRYVVNGDTVTFTPRLPQRPDRADSGFRANGEYHVFLKAGPDSLVSTEGDLMVTQQEFLFDTSDFFDDVFPTEPPRALRLLARDTTTGLATDISRLDPRPTQLGNLDSNDLVTAGAIIEPGAGGAPNFSTAWQIELHVSEPLDPQTVNTRNVSMLEIRNDALDTATTAAPGTFGTAVNFKVPILVDMVQRLDANGDLEMFVRVRPIQTLVDDARYRITLSGNILGLDFRKQFIGDNGLTGDGQSQTSSLAQGGILPEPGGLGYTAEFLVFDRPAISTQRTLTYDPGVDGIFPETGKTTTDEALFNTALYNPLSDPGKAVGFLAAFGSGRDGPFSVSGSGVTVLDTGDVPNPEIGNVFTVTDLNPDDEYAGSPVTGTAGAPQQWGTGATDANGDPVRVNPEPFELEVDSFVVSSSATLRVTGKNPLMVRVAGIVQVAGIIDLTGGAGGNGGAAFAAGGAAAAGGFPGGSTTQGNNTCSYRSGSCTNFQSYLNGCSAARSTFPHTTSGEGPGRGMAGGETYCYYATDEKNRHSASGGGGGSHAFAGGVGEDRRNLNGAPGTGGSSCSTFTNIRVAGVIGVRGEPGDTYGDKDVALVFLGGSGGAGGGSISVYNFGSNQMAGGGGGGGGGSITVIASGTILVTGGIIDASGGDGGKGAIKSGNVTFSWDTVSGGGGGGAGGAIALISGDDINLTAAVLTAAGGAGGPRGNAGTTTTCNSCNGGGAGGTGYIFLMDADGLITGFLFGAAGDYSLTTGELRVKAFDASRFSTISAVTELFPMPAANPDYQPIAPGDVLAVVNPGQTIVIFASSSKADPDDPLLPNPAPGSENPPIQVATVSFTGGGVVVSIDNSIEGLNQFATPDREAFARVRADFDYANGVEAALGPFAAVDEITITITFNG